MSEFPEKVGREAIQKQIWEWPSMTLTRGKQGRRAGRMDVWIG